MSDKVGDYDVFFVLNGLVDGEEGNFAIPSGPPDGKPRPDGWYWWNADTDKDSGPYKSKEGAIRSTEKQPITFSFALDGSFRRCLPEDEGSERTNVSVTKKSPHHFIIECDDYYGPGGICRLEIAQNLNRALATFAGLLLADSQQEEKSAMEAHNG